MTLAVGFSPQLTSLLKALGLVGPDGLVDANWFEHPLDRLRTIVSDVHQRAALLELLEGVLPALRAGNAPDTARWHPLLDPAGRGNLYLTVDGDTIGVVGMIETPETVTPKARAAIRLPLVDLSGGAIKAIAGSPEGPLELSLNAEWSATSHPSGVGVFALVDTAGGGSLRIVLENLDPTSAPGTRTELDPTKLDSRAIRVISSLLQDVLAQVTGGDPRVGRVVAHLPGVLGIDALLQPLPLADLLRDPNALRSWFALIAADANAFAAWFTHLAGLLGAGLPAASPTVSGAGTPASPLRAPVLDLGGGATVDLTLAAAAPAGGTPSLLVGLALSLPTPVARVEGAATLVALPLAGSTPAVALPAAHLTLTTPAAGSVVDQAPTIKLGTVVAGLAWDGVQLSPHLELLDVVLANKVYARLDLTNANSVVDAASGAVQGALSAAIGTTGLGRSLQALIGLLPPATDLGTPHTLGLAELVQNPTRAIAEIHRAALADAQHDWGHQFGELASLLGFTGAVSGEGSRHEPWRVQIATQGLASLELAAWNARDADTPAGTQLLRLGLRVSFDSAPWKGGWMAELLTFDLPQNAPASTRLLGGQYFSLTLIPGALPNTSIGLGIAATSISATADWVPGAAARWAIVVQDLVLTGSGGAVGPVTLSFPSSTFDPLAADFGLGIPVGTLTALLRLLLAEALHSWGGNAAFVVGGLFGVHRGLGGLPENWPLLEPPNAADVGSLFADPLGAIRSQIERVLNGSSADGTPFVVSALPWFRSLLQGQLPASSAEPPSATLSLDGAGTYEHPWAHPLEDNAVELLCWLEPAGPPAAWQHHLAERLRLAIDGASLVSLLDQVAALLPEVNAARRGRSAGTAGLQLERLHDWLALGDGVVAAAAQVVDDPNWRVGAPVIAAHHDQPSDPGAIAQITQQLDDWTTGGTRAVVLLGPSFTDHRAWSEYLAAAEPARSADAHFDLRVPGVDPLTVDLTHVTAVATHYTADFTHGTTGSLSAQLGRVVARVRALTGRTQVYLVAHSTAGVVARAFAAANSALVGGVVTLGTPHTPSPFTPLIDAALAEGVRLAELLQPAVERTPIGRAIGNLTIALDGTRVYPADAFAGVAAGTVDVVPGLAIPGWLGTSLFDELADSIADRAKAAADRVPPPTHFAFGVRVRANRAGAAAGDIGVRTSARLDAARFALGGTLAELARPARAVTVHMDVERSGSWLIGGANPVAGARLRRAELGLTVQQAVAGGVAVTPTILLYDVGAFGSIRSQLGLDDLLAQPNLPSRVALTAARPAAGTPNALLVDVLEAVGVIVPDGTGGLALGLDELVAGATHAVARFGSRVPALIDVIAAEVGATSPSIGTWVLQSGSLPLELEIRSNPWMVRVRTHDPATAVHSLELAGGIAISLEAQVALPTFASSATASVELGGATLGWTSTTGVLTVDTPGANVPLQLLPAPPIETLRAELGRRVPMIAASAIVSGTLSALLGGSVRVRRIDRLLTSPGDWLLSPDALGTTTGVGLDPVKVVALLEVVGRALGLQSAGGIALPGGLTLTATGTDPLTLALDGNIALGAGTDELELQLGLQLDRALAVSPAGKVVLRITLPGNWGRIVVEFGVDASALSLSVTAGTQTIVLLPKFSGFGALAAGASVLLPRVLQAVVDELAPQPAQATGLVRAALLVAKGLEFYDFDAQGFEAPARAATLGKILERGWLVSKASSAPAVMQALGPIFADPTPLIDLPGTVAVAGSTIRWTYSITATGRVSATLGWTGAGASAEPALTIELQGVQLGPIVADEVTLGYDNGVACHVALHLDPGGEIGFLQPALDLDVAAGVFSFEAYPLGAADKADFIVRVAPVPGVVTSAAAPLELLERWGLPLVAKLLLHEFDAKLTTSLWNGGPTARSVLDQAGLVVQNSAPPKLASPLPAIPELALRALKALVTNVTISVTPTLDLTLVADAAKGRRGIRLKGRQDFSGDDLDISMRFGKADWLADPDAGVTLWLLEDTAGMPPVRITPALDVTGLGVMLGGSDGDPLLNGAFEVGAAGGFLFFGATFIKDVNSARIFALDVSELGGAVELDRSLINVSSDDGDSFIKKVLPPELQAPFGLTVAWREGTGLTVYGGPGGNGLELTLPLDIDLTVIRLTELYLALKRAAGMATIEAAMSGNASLGPLHAVVQRVGLKVSLGSEGARLGFRAPDGLGLSLDAGIVAGGGFLFVDEAKGQYAGAIQLHLQTLSLTAIGLLNTKMPDGSPIPGPFGLPGFSLLIIIVAEFPPIQLGFGFTLVGIGGLLGLNRTIDVPALRAGVRSRALDTMLFPPDPVANAAAVVKALSTIFPVAPDRFLVGPMVRLGWGTPPILTLDIGILIELPSPIRVVVLGRMKLALPQDDEVAIVVIHLDVVGIIDFGRGEISIDAILYDSMIAGFTLSGEMALRMRWKDSPTFALAVGGFHPGFQPPSGFPMLARMAISLATGDNPRLRLEAYLAVTSNSIQFGAAIEVHAEAAGFEVDGHLMFDALIYLAPFGLQVDIDGAVSIRFNGAIICSVGLALHLTGPAPWHIWGSAHVQVLFISATVSFDARIGSARLPPPPPPVRVSVLLEAAVADAANWSAQPPNGEGVVTLRSDPAGNRVAAHPLGGLEFRQRVVPLELTIARYGAADVDGASRFEITDVDCGSKPIPAAQREDVHDSFAAAQFFSLSDDEKLSRPSFEPFVSGVALHFDAYDLDDLAASEAAPLGYELIVVDEEEDGTAPETMMLGVAVAVTLAANGPAAGAASRRSGLRRFDAPAAAVQVTDRQFAVVSALDAHTGPEVRTQNFSLAVEEARRVVYAGKRLAIVRVREEPS